MEKSGLRPRKDTGDNDEAKHPELPTTESLHHPSSTAAAPARAHQPPRAGSRGHAPTRQVPLRPLAQEFLDTPAHTPTPTPPWEAREDGDCMKVGITCEPGEPGNALGDWEPLKVCGELHFHDAGHALQHHPCRRRPFLSQAPAPLQPSCRACAESGGDRWAPEVRAPAAAAATGGAVSPGTRGDLPGADWQRASDVRARWTPRGRGRPRAPELRGRVGSGPSLGLDFEECLRVGPFTSVGGGSRQKGCCVR